ncbi:alpha/beta hydrolase fold domain-containing protein [Nocardioides litoris]|uniref:alpha/beta hydrolase fold domain-containing protein n=1 Tax=Nocardioides litoris TaxID=1926648 RepID=UPI0011213B73|nr:alpha/beta hydrolase fold domain-containing protein [Nocardioides litoris]
MDDSADGSPAPDLSDRAAEVLRTAPPAAIPVPLNRLTIHLVRLAVRRRSRELLAEARALHPVRTSRTEVGVCPVTVVEPAAHDADEVLVYLHGGAFVLGEPVDPVVVQLAARTGLRCLSVHYPLAPERRAPAALDRVETAWRALTADRPGRPLLVGTSAGGNLALGLVQRLLADGSTAVQPSALALLSPAADLHDFAGDRLANEGLDPVIRWTGMLDKALPAYLGDRPADDPEVSPVLGDYTGLTCPVLLTTAGVDLLRPDVVALARTLEAQGVDVRLDDQPSLWHLYQQQAVMPEAQASVGRLVAFLDAARGSAPR